MPPSTLSGPGILWVNSGVTDADKLSYEAFIRWYEDVHIPDVMTAPPGSPMPATWRYECLAPGWPAPVLVVYKVPDLAFGGSDAFRSIPMTHQSLPGGGPIGLYAAFDARFAQPVTSWKRPGIDAVGPAGQIVSEAADDGTETETVTSGPGIRHWYADTYMPTIARLPGWRRTTRFLIAVHNKISGGSASRSPTSDWRPRWLSLHEFEEGSFGEGPTSVAALLAMGDASNTDIAAHLDAHAISMEVLPFRLERVYGDRCALLSDCPIATLETGSS